MDKLLKFYYTKIAQILLMALLYNLAILHNNFIIFLIPSVVLVTINTLLKGQSFYFNEILLKSLPLDKQNLCYKIIRFMIVSLLLVTICSIIYFFSLKQFDFFITLNIGIVIVTFLLSLPSTILTFNPFLSNILLPKSDIGLIFGYTIPLAISLITFIIFANILNLEGTSTQLTYLTILSLPLYFFSTRSTLNTYEEILKEIDRPIDFN
ncbi:hypothetical protein EDD79_10911 [Serpentinicella alkaliphila]|uniref:Uncharacterized protein n=1 Tax=Serpentinicella alkaliphila TaxID=1734049 RepID=A0A4R2SSK1_9FIRM|nr:hypothetical protein EDD79_10911 [Serpentinicella alkaliphila]